MYLPCMEFIECPRQSFLHHSFLFGFGCLLIGVLPEYRPKGANALLFYDLIPIYQKHGFLWGETHVEMETNGKVQSQWTYLEHEQHKRRRCYKKAL